MTYRLVIDPAARRDIQEFTEYLVACSERFSTDQLIRLSFVFQVYLSETPIRRHEIRPAFPTDHKG